MSGELIGFAPEPAVLWNGDDQASSGSQRGEHCPQRVLVAVDVLENVERSDEIERAVDTERSCVHLREGYALESPARHAESFREHFHADRLQVGPRAVDRRQDIPRPAPDLEEGLSVREPSIDRPQDELVSPPKPEAPRLKGGERFEERCVVALRAPSKRRACAGNRRPRPLSDSGHMPTRRVRAATRIHHTKTKVRLLRRSRRPQMPRIRGYPA